MTDAGWAEKKARNGVQYISCITDDEVYSLIAKLLKAEHARAIRLVKRLKKQAHLDEFSMSADQLDAYLEALNDVLTALQRGRGGKG